MESTVIFLDWDDTLLCSSYLSGQGYRLDSELESSSPIDRELKELESSVIGLLRLAMTFGDVHVVTNAETGWVQLSAKKFLPGVVPVLDQKLKLFLQDLPTKPCSQINLSNGSSVRFKNHCLQMPSHLKM